MTLHEALNQLRNWCDRSNGQPIELLPDKTAVFESRSVHDSDELSRVEHELGFQFPDSYRNFMQTIGASSLFSWSPHGGGPRFYTPTETIEASRGLPTGTKMASNIVSALSVSID